MNGSASCQSQSRSVYASNQNSRKRKVSVTSDAFPSKRESEGLVRLLPYAPEWE